ncbi:ankyrin repeat-containing domain protein [Daldinia decipiens]|uniref:ankyrin repeat-containing domain protein n=1 Tax=Daldinia decipiens TaxID=326647 RepID=UPI0020C2116A|nr:ankyrin repeat-containing domain protein [Daldinia decipiens]KAI1659491.1 ankyrin repeat-containing domain protein [Daldinia decipiens]
MAAEKPVMNSTSPGPDLHSNVSTVRGSESVQGKVSVPRHEGLSLQWSTPGPNPDQPDSQTTSPKEGITYIDIIFIPRLFDLYQQLDTLPKWLLDYTRSANLNVRLFRFEYDPNEVVRSLQCRRVIRRLSLELLDSIAGQRNDEVKRVVMFVAFDIGGIIVKDALSQASQALGSWIEILDHTRMLVLSHCPHRCKSLTGMQDSLSRLLFTSPPELEIPLRPSTAALPGLAAAIVEINGSFISSKVLLRTRLISIYTTMQISSGVHEYFNTFTLTLGTPFETRIHENTQSNFGLILGNLFRNFERVTKFVPRLFDHEHTLVSLATAVEPFRTDCNLKAQLRGYSTYREWFDNRSGQLLYAHGIENIQETAEQVFYQLDAIIAPTAMTHVTLYFTFDRQDIRRNRLSQMLFTFLAQIVCHHPSPRSSVMTLKFLDTERAWTENDLIYWLEQALLRFDGIRIVINDFDECDANSRKAFIQYVSRAVVINEKTWKVFVTSRADNLSDELSEWRSLDLSLAPTSDDIQLDSLQDTEKRQQISEDLPQSYDFDHISWEIPSWFDDIDFLARSIIQEQLVRRTALNRNAAPDDFLRPTDDITANTPPELIIDRILRNISDKPLLLLILSWILYSTKPLSIWELATVVFISREQDGGSASLLEKTDIEVIFPDYYSWLAWLAGIIRIDNNEIHVSNLRIRDIFMTPKAEEGPTYIWHEIAADAHHQIATTCLAYLSRPSIQERYVEFIDRHAENDPSIIILDDSRDLFSYAVEYWFHHYMRIQDRLEKIGKLDQLFQEVGLRRWPEAFWIFTRPVTVSDNCWKTPFPPLASLGCLEVRPESDEDLEAGILEAALNGHVKEVQKLVRSKTWDQDAILRFIEAAGPSGQEQLVIDLINYLELDSYDTISEWGPSLLYRAARLNFDQLAETLLSKGCPIDCNSPLTGDSSMDLLRVASSSGHLKTVRVLVTHGADINSGSFDGNSLTSAILGGHVEIIEFLAKENREILEHSIYDGGTPRPSPLCFSCGWGRPTAVQKLLELGTDPNKPDPGGMKPIEIAAKHRNERCVEALLNHGVDPDTPSGIGKGTSMHHAVANGSVQICQLLLEHGADPNNPLLKSPLLHGVVNRTLPFTTEQRIGLTRLLVKYNVNINATDEQKATPLLIAIRNQFEDLARCLLEYEPDVNLADVDGRTPIYEAVRNQDEGLVKLLLERGADVNVQTTQGLIPLHVASSSTPITQLLVEKTNDLNLKNDSGLTQLMFLASKGWTASVKVLLEHKADTEIEVDRTATNWVGYTAISFAAFYNHPETITLLASYGANLNHKESIGLNPLHLAIDGIDGIEGGCLQALMEFRTRIDIDQVDNAGETALGLAAFENELKPIQLFVRGGSNINSQDNMGRTALAKASKETIVSYLLGQGADPNMRGLDPTAADSPIHEACGYSYFEIAKQLLDFGADIETMAVSGYGTPLMRACLPWDDSKKEDPERLIKYLIDRGANVNAKSYYVGSPVAAAALGMKSSIVQLLLEKGVSVNSEDALGRRPIHFAALHSIANFRILVEAKADIEAKDKLHRGVLHWAAQVGGLEVIKHIIELNPQVDVDQRDIDGWTPLCWVAKGGGNWLFEDNANDAEDTIGVTRALLEQHADRSIQCPVGNELWTPLEMASYFGADPGVIDLLKNGLEKEDQGQSSEDIPTPNEENQPGLPRAAHVHDAAWCDSCFLKVKGLCYACKTCFSYILCQKCYVHLDIVHEYKHDHEFEERGPEYDAISESNADEDDQSETSSVTESSIDNSEESSEDTKEEEASGSGEED